MTRYIKPLPEYVRLLVNHVSELVIFPPSIEIFLTQMSSELIVCEHESYGPKLLLGRNTASYS